MHKIDQFSYETLEKERLSKTVIPIDKKQILKYTVHNNEIKKNLNDSKNTLSSFTTNSSSLLTVQKKCDANNTELVTDVLPMSQNDKNKCCNNNKFFEVIPNIVYRMYPKYPSHARVLGIEGKLVVLFDINVLGKIENVRILSAIPVGIFERNVRSAMRHWIYESDKPKKDLTVTFKFCLSTSEIFDYQKTE